jgi:hypothetical protein
MLSTFIPLSGTWEARAEPADFCPAALRSLQGHFAAFARVRADPAASLFRQRDAFCSPASADTHGRGASR